ncbi:5-methylcytosine-specific restriction enzyme subunit McrB [Escherichia coli]|nr:5-methylcytosine-specific restriction enzyme subunit McrB [Escherichia coli]
MNPVLWLQMTNMISYQGLVRTFLNEIVMTDIAPLLEEYFFDDPYKQQKWTNKLLGDS